MGSLFDLADSVFQCKTAAAPIKPSSAPPTLRCGASVEADVPTLFLLDETLRQIQVSRDKNLATSNQNTSLPREPWRYKSETNFITSSSPCLASERKSNHEQSPLRRVYSNTLLQVEDSNNSPKAKESFQQDAKVNNSRGSTEPSNNNQQAREVSTSQDTDATARSVLKTFTEEIDAFEKRALSDMPTPYRFAEHIQQKYLEGALATLPDTSFVKLARKKVLSKVQEYKLRKDQSSYSETNQPNQCSTEALTEFGDDIRETLKLFRKGRLTDDGAKSITNVQLPIQKEPPNFSDLKTNVFPQPLSKTDPPQQQIAMLEKLMKLPRSQLEKLPKAQRELVEFSKKYQVALTMSPEKLASLPPHQQQMVKQLRAKVGDAYL
ncbi:hypothetical protein AC1031_004513 [Aphanomyces cochlioides]|nr:hypothetical protein AC1031_004513 [Aphanomyces cochlioides]